MSYLSSLYILNETIRVQFSLINHTLGQWSLYNLELQSVPGYEVVTPPQRVLAAPNANARPRKNQSAPNQKFIVGGAFIFAGSRSKIFYVIPEGVTVA